MNLSFLQFFLLFNNVAQMQIYRMIYLFFNMAGVRNFKFSKFTIQLTSQWVIVKKQQAFRVAVWHWICRILFYVCVTWSLLESSAHVVIKFLRIRVFCGWDIETKLYSSTTSVRHIGFIVTSLCCIRKCILCC